MERVRPSYVIHDEGCASISVVNLIHGAETLASSSVPQLNLNLLIETGERYDLLVEAGVDRSFRVVRKVVLRPAPEYGRLAATWASNQNNLKLIHDYNY